MPPHHHVDKYKRIDLFYDGSSLAFNRTGKAGELFFVAQSEVYYEDQQLMHMN